MYHARGTINTLDILVGELRRNHRRPVLKEENNIKIDRLESEDVKKVITSKGLLSGD
jgi:hypothetical protein